MPAKITKIKQAPQIKRVLRRSLSTAEKLAILRAALLGPSGPSGPSGPLARPRSDGLGAEKARTQRMALGHG